MYFEYSTKNVNQNLKVLSTLMLLDTFYNLQIFVFQCGDEIFNSTLITTLRNFLRIKTVDLVTTQSIGGATVH